MDADGSCQGRKRRGPPWKAGKASMEGDSMEAYTTSMEVNPTSMEVNFALMESATNSHRSKFSSMEVGFAPMAVIFTSMEAGGNFDGSNLINQLLFRETVGQKTNLKLICISCSVHEPRVFCLCISRMLHVKLCECNVSRS